MQAEKPKLVVLNLPDARDLSGEELKTVLIAIADGINKLGEEVTEIKTELKAWSGWLRLVAGTIIVTIGIAFIGIVIPLLLRSVETKRYLKQLTTFFSRVAA